MAESQDIRFREVERWPKVRSLLPSLACFGFVLAVGLLGGTWMGTRRFLYLWFGAFALSAPLEVLSWQLFGLATEVRGDGLYVRRRIYRPPSRRIPLEGLTTCEVVRWGTWDALRRRGPFRGRKRGSYYLMPDMRSGVRLEYADGKFVFIGSQRPEELAEAIRGLLQQGNSANQGAG